MTKILSCVPEVLVLYFDRFVNFGYKQTKIQNLINFPLEGLDLNDFVDTESSYFESSWKQNPVYDLHVMIEHIGSDKTSNRYVTIAKHLPEGKWFEYDDHLVREVSEANLRKREVLFLFYVKRKPSSNTTNGQNHLPLNEIQSKCKELIEARFDQIQIEKKYYIKLKKRNERKKSLVSPEILYQIPLISPRKSNGVDGEETIQEENSADPYQSNKILTLESTTPLISAGTTKSTNTQLPSDSKWHIIRNNLSTIREFGTSSKKLKLNSKWQFIQQNLHNIVEMKNLSLNLQDQEREKQQLMSISYDEENLSQPLSHSKESNKLRKLFKVKRKRN